MEDSDLNFDFTLPEKDAVKDLSVEKIKSTENVGTFINTTGYLKVQAQPTSMISTKFFVTPIMMKSAILNDDSGAIEFELERDVKLSPSKYFNQRLLSYKQSFASEADYIFFAHSLYQQLNMMSSINIAMQKVRSNSLTAGMLSQNFKETVKSFVANDKAFSFMSTIKGTPAYWKKFLFQVLAMVKQLGLPTYFMTLSCADLRWNELPTIISRLNE